METKCKKVWNSLCCWLPCWKKKSPKEPDNEITILLEDSFDNNYQQQQPATTFKTYYQQTETTLDVEEQLSRRRSKYAALKICAFDQQTESTLNVEDQVSSRSKDAALKPCTGDQTETTLDFEEQLSRRRSKYAALKICAFDQQQTESTLNVEDQVSSRSKDAALKPFTGYKSIIECRELNLQEHHEKMDRVKAEFKQCTPLGHEVLAPAASTTLEREGTSEYWDAVCTQCSSVSSWVEHNPYQLATLGPGLCDLATNQGLDRVKTAPINHDANPEEDTSSDSEEISSSLMKRGLQAVLFSERKIFFKAKAEKAIELKKIFWMESPEPVITEGLNRRGWVQKLSITLDYKKTVLFDPDIPYNNRLCLSYNVKPTLLWLSFGIDASLLEEYQIINYINRADFISKVGLYISLKQLWWLNGVDSDTFFPRCYCLSNNDEMTRFIGDFKLTAACGILKCVVRRHTKPLEGEDAYFSKREADTHGGYSLSVARRKRIVPACIILEALEICKTSLGRVKREDTGNESDEMTVDWNKFHSYYYQIVHDGADIENSAVYVDECSQVLHKIQMIAPQFLIDGERNIWILKPGFSSRGRGITCMNRLEEIVKFVEMENNPTNPAHWIIQKYIERPLLIYGTKVDMRQFFLVSDWNPLTIWFYKQNYLRFSTQPFTLESLDNSIHLCNRSIQKYLKNCPTRHPDLPENNIWSNTSLQEYLCMIGAEHAWEDVMVPGMKKALIHTMRASQNNIKYRKNSFDFYGADFMFDEDFHPWLIEINFRPDTTSPTAVTGGIFRDLLEDTLRVIIDRKNSPDCDTGEFELIFKKP